jgi:uncharacterized damage-inducible protein DinB
MDDVLDAARRVLSTTAGRWQTLLETMPGDLLERQPAPGEWSAADCLRHLLGTERSLLSVRLRHILEGRAELVPFDPAAPRAPDPERTPQEVVAAFVAQRRETEAALAGLTAADLDRSSFHPEYGKKVTLGHLLNLWAAHDLLHTVQAEQALMQVFIHGTGPWRSVFADHDVEARGELT